METANAVCSLVVISAFKSKHIDTHTRFHEDNARCREVQSAHSLHLHLPHFPHLVEGSERVSNVEKTRWREKVAKEVTLAVACGGCECDGAYVSQSGSRKVTLQDVHASLVVVPFHSFGATRHGLALSALFGASRFARAAAAVEGEEEKAYLDELSTPRPNLSGTGNMVRLACRLLVVVVAQFASSYLERSRPARIVALDVVD